MSDSSSTYTGTVLWYFEALLIGIILPQFEGRFKHFLLVIRIIHTSRSFLQKQHQHRKLLEKTVKTTSETAATSDETQYKWKKVERTEKVTASE